jgi:hypothetical protein
MNSEKASKEDALKKIANFEAERDAAVKAYVPPHLIDFRIICPSDYTDP